MDWTTLPGETPITDISGLKVKGIRTRAELNVCEAENVRKAVVKYLTRKPSRRSAKFDLPWMLKLHREMFGAVWAWAGKIRTSPTNIGVVANQIEASLYNLMNDLAYWEASPLPVLEQAVLLHHRAVAIHPFLNGNGRWARMLANIWLKLHGLAPTAWPEDAIGDTSPIRAEYLKAIRAADEGDLQPLTELQQRFTVSPAKAARKRKTASAEESREKGDTEDVSGTMGPR